MSIASTQPFTSESSPACQIGSAGSQEKDTDLVGFSVAETAGRGGEGQRVQ